MKKKHLFNKKECIVSNVAHMFSSPAAVVKKGEGKQIHPLPSLNDTLSMWLLMSRCFIEVMKDLTTTEDRRQTESDIMRQ